MANTMLGISIGDIITTSYSTGPYIVHVLYGPYYTSPGLNGLVIRTWPVVGLECGDAWINDVRQEGDRWFTDSNDEIYVQSSEPEGQLLLFDLPHGEQPYSFDPQVDYHRFGEVWRCARCGIDYNAPDEPEPWRGGICPRCGRATPPGDAILLMPPRIVGVEQLNAYIFGLSSPAALLAEWAKVTQYL